MLLVFHIAVAFLSMAWAFFACVLPSRSKLFVAYVFAGSTLASGIVLLAQRPSHLVPACVAGLAYFAVVGCLIALAQRRFARYTE